MIAPPGVGAEFDVAIGEFADVEHRDVVTLLENDADLDAGLASRVSKDDGVERSAADAVAVVVDVENADLHDVIPFLVRAGHVGPPGCWCGLVFLFGDNAEGDPAVEGDRFELKVVSLAVLVGPCRPDAGEDSLLSLAVADLVDGVARDFRRAGFIAVGHGRSPLCFKAA